MMEELKRAFKKNFGSTERKTLENLFKFFKYIGGVTVPIRGKLSLVRG
jgi:hypothetical protein